MTMSKKNMLIIAGIAVGGLGLASMMLENGDGGENIPEKIKQRAGNILGTTGTGEVGSTVYNIPARGEIVLPSQEAPFEWGAWLDSQLVGNGEKGVVTETQDKPIAQRGGHGAAFAIAESIPYGEDVVTSKKIPYDPSIASPAEAPYYAGRDIRAAVLGTGAHIGKSGVAMKESFAGLYGDILGRGVPATSTQITTTPGVLRPEAVGTAGAAMSRSFRGLFSSIAKAGSNWSRGITGVAKKEYAATDMSRAAIKSRGYLGTGMTQSEHASQYAGTLYAKGSAAPKKYPTATAAQMESTAARRAAFETVTKLSKKRPVK
jgi:hypothetical protein